MPPRASSPELGLLGLIFDLYSGQFSGVFDAPAISGHFKFIYWLTEVVLESA